MSGGALRWSVVLWGERVSLTGAPLSRDPEIARLQVAGRSESTRSAYASQLASLQRWSTAAGLEPWSVDTVARWLAEMVSQGLGRASVVQAYSAARCAWRATGRVADWAVVQAAKRGAIVEAVADGRGRGQARALRLVDLRRACDVLVGEADWPPVAAWKAARDRALLLLGWLGGFRSSELRALREREVEVTPLGLVVSLAGAKGRRDERIAVGIPTGQRSASCPVAAWHAWRAVRESVRGPELVTDGRLAFVGADGRALGENSITRVVRARLSAAGVEDADSYSAHSLRAGLATELASAGVPLSRIAEAGHWKSLSVVAGYANRGRMFADAAQKALDY